LIAALVTLALTEGAAQQRPEGKHVKVATGAELSLMARDPRSRVALDPRDYAERRSAWLNTLGPRLRREVPQPGRESRPWPRMTAEGWRQALADRLRWLDQIELDRSEILDRIPDPGRRRRALDRLRRATEAELQGAAR
jgi:hypothetical protein